MSDRAPAARDASPSTASPGATRARKAGLGLLLGLAGSVFVLDLASKLWAKDALASGPMPVAGDTLQFRLAFNPGGAFSLGHWFPDWLRLPFFIVVGIGAVIFIVSLYRRVQPGQWAYRWGLPLVLGGAAGNLCDRFLRGSVIDFIDYRAGWVRVLNEGIHYVFSSWYVSDHWPTFNVADIAICVGLGLMFVEMLRGRRAESKADESKDQERSGEPGA